MAFLFLVLAVIGAITVTLMVIDSLWSVLELVTSYLTPYFLPNEVQELSKRFGPWAVVTGSTDGIGRQYSLELARQGLNVVLISRNRTKLDKVAAEIEQAHSVKTKVIVADFSQGPAVYGHIEQELRDIPVGILVNNVGVNYDYPMPLCEVSPAKAWELIHVNVGAVTLLCRLLLPAMAARGRGAVVNVSSGSELQPLPLMTVYAATKAYVRSFTLAIREEYPSLCIQHLAPLFVSTKINAFSQRIMDGHALVPDAATYARHAVSTLGRVRNTTGYWVHGLQYTAIKISPVWVRTKIGLFINRQFRREYMDNQVAGKSQ